MHVVGRTVLLPHPIVDQQAYERKKYEHTLGPHLNHRLNGLPWMCRQMHAIELDLNIGFQKMSRTAQDEGGN